MKSIDRPTPLNREIHAVVGMECSLYFSALHWAPMTDSSELSIRCPVGNHLAECWRFTPRAGDVGEHRLTLNFLNPSNGEPVTMETSIRTHQGRVGSDSAPLRWLAIGDSITASGLYIDALLRRAATEGGRVESLGTCLSREDGLTPHEGYPGWKWRDFLKRRVNDDEANYREEKGPPFVFEDSGSPVLDFSRYVERSLQGREPDVITIFLGTNDIALLDEETFQAGMDDSLDAARTLVAAILKGTSKCKVGVIAPLPPAPSQDAFGINYGCRIPRWRYRKNQHAMVLALQEQFENFDKRVSLIPAFLQIDPATAYPLSENRVHSHTAQTHAVFCNAVHPSAPGAGQIADSIFAWMAGVA